MTTVRSDIAPETTAIPGLGQLNAEDLAGQTVLMRIDAAVPANAHEALRDAKLKTALASLDLLLSSKARVAFLAHPAKTAAIRNTARARIRSVLTARNG